MLNILAFNYNELLLITTHYSRILKKKKKKKKFIPHGLISPTTPFFLFILSFSLTGLCSLFFFLFLSLVGLCANGSWLFCIGGASTIVLMDLGGVVDGFGGTMGC